MYQHEGYNLPVLQNKPENLAELLAEQGNKIRDLRAKAGNEWHHNPEVLEAVWHHLALKSWDYDLGKVLPEHRGPRTIKIRWKIAGNPKETRFQNIFPNRYYLQGHEIIGAIHRHMAKPKIIEKHGDYSKIEKIQFIVDKKLVDIRDGTLVKMPIVYPGPTMAFQGKFEFKVIPVGYVEPPPKEVVTPTPKAEKPGVDEKPTGGAEGAAAVEGAADAKPAKPPRAAGGPKRRAAPGGGRGRGGRGRGRGRGGRPAGRGRR